MLFGAVMLVLWAGRLVDLVAVVAAGDEVLAAPAERPVLIGDLAVPAQNDGEFGHGITNSDSLDRTKATSLEADFITAG